MNRATQSTILGALLLFPLTAVSQPSVPDAIEPTVETEALAANVVYPKDAIRAGVTGRVVVRALIDTNGSVAKASVYASDDRRLDQAALDAVMKTPFTSACQNGKPIRLWISVPIHFTLEGLDPVDSGPSPDADLGLSTEATLDLFELRKFLRYPEHARSLGIQGTVVVRVFVDELGIARRYRIEKTANSILNAAAIDAIFSTRFRPAERDGRPVSSWVTVPVTFSLQ